jgi:hypothetical protein
MIFFALVKRYFSVWVLRGIGVMMDFKIHKMDEKSTFFHHEFKENVYMVQPYGYE